MFKILYISMLFLSSFCFAQTVDDKSSQKDLSQVITQYRKSLSKLPVDYLMVEKKQLGEVTFKKYKLNSQSWDLEGSLSPEKWQHDVDLYIPDFARETNALVVINDGSNDDGSGHSLAPTNFTQEQLSRIALATKTIVISVSNVPNQPLTYHGVAEPLVEDNSVALSWRLFIDDSSKYQNASLHIPMSAAVSQALRLAKSELTAHKITHFIVTGASKRGWAAWLTALSDPDVVAIVPFAMDLLNTQEALKHMYRSYGNNWPVAFYPYYQQEIDRYIDTAIFSRLMTLEDPLSYLSKNVYDRFKIEKYIINASGDDFYAPDNIRLYYDQLPAPKSLRVVANSAHKDILDATASSLIPFINRYQKKISLPEMTETISGDNKTIKVKFSEKPSSILQWTAQNTESRDFRYACGIKYHATPLGLAEDKIEIPLTIPHMGWQATYIEATFSDGYVATSQVYITPDEYPKTAPPSKGSACQTLPGRKLRPSGK